MLSDTENRKVSEIEFCTNWIDTDGKVKYNFIELKTSEDLKVIWRTCHRRLTTGPIEFDATIYKYVDDIIKMLKRSESYSIVYVLQNHMWVINKVII